MHGTVAVIGGGINGLCIAWELACRGWQVDLFERGRCLAQTSSASTKLLHGGLRYLEQGHLALVAESLRERARWLRDAPQLCRWLPLLLPIVRQRRRPSWQWRLGLGLYDGLALGRLPGFARWLPPEAVADLQPDLVVEGLQGAWQFWDGQMDEQGLGRWVKDQAHGCGVEIHEHTPVEWANPCGWLNHAAGSSRFDWLVNAAGPWAVELLDRSDLATDVRLDLVRGSHLLVPVPAGASLMSTGLFVEVPGSARIAFLLPYQGELLVGTTEDVQSLEAPITASASEQELLLELVARHLPAWAASARRQGRFFAGLRPIVRSTADVSRASRDAVFRRHGQLISVFGGKWTTARALAERLAHAAPFNGQP
ncbi:MAG: FAD-dependent oxidoreductase [Cyanobacteria bacterium K_Offshore_0m_m2_072]|nr:FAD-dependent oxidoreductase [Cyanobacteria bacterium K_Offshore_0m_m2_072]